MNELIILALTQEGGGQQPSMITSLVPLLLMFAVFYFLLIRPQAKRQREHQAMLSRLKRGDRVVTNGGLIGVVTALTESEIELEIASKVKVRVIRNQVTALPEAAGDAAGKGS